MSDTGEHQVVHLWSLGEDVIVVGGDDRSGTILCGPWGAQRIETDDYVREALYRMSLGPVRLTNVEYAPGAGGGAHLHLRLEPVLRQVAHLVVRTLAMDDLRGPLLSVHPLSRQASFTLVGVEEGSSLRLVLGTSLAMRTEGLVVETPGSPYRVGVHRPEAGWVVGTRIRPCRVENAVAALPLPAGVIRGRLGYLRAAGGAAPADPGPVRHGPDDVPCPSDDGPR
ncbi:NADH oxidase [Streptomyces pilosus]